MRKAILAGVTASVLLVSACSSTGGSADPNGSAESTVPTGARDTVPGPNELDTSGDNDPAPPTEIEKLTPGPAFGVSDVEVKALSEGAGVTQEAAEVFEEVDFLNFVYEFDIGIESMNQFETVDGEYLDEDLFFAVTNIQYGDIGEDGAVEAVVYVHYNTGGTGQFTDVIVYGLDDGGAPVQLATAGSGDRANGGIESGRIRDGSLQLSRFEGDAACCPTKVLTYEYRDWKDGFLQPLGEPEKEAFVSFDGPPNVNPPDYDSSELKFLPGTSSARMFGSGDSNPLTFEAFKGQTTRVELTSEIFGQVSLSLTDSTTGEVLGEIQVNTAITVELPNDGEYVLTPSVISAELDDVSPGFEAEIQIN